MHLKVDGHGKLILEEFLIQIDDPIHRPTGLFDSMVGFVDSPVAWLKQETPPWFDRLVHGIGGEPFSSNENRSFPPENPSPE
jgi:hypothetical protein